MSARLYLFDDARARRWDPFALTRPAAELVLGALRLWERAARAWGVEYGGHLAGARLAGFQEDETPRALAASDLGPGVDPNQVASRAVVRSGPRRVPPVP
ncbi:MAG: putative sugar nucleotidyl transferase, partial [Gammaproteobacteria bacterium]|nr:putative sugar nucleotidyl transferase [Gammaproteobacteria bacterium]